MAHARWLPLPSAGPLTCRLKCRMPRRPTSLQATRWRPAPLRNLTGASIGPVIVIRPWSMLPCRSAMACPLPTPSVPERRHFKRRSAVTLMLGAGRSSACICRRIRIPRTPLRSRSPTSAASRSRTPVPPATPHGMHGTSAIATPGSNPLLVTCVGATGQFAQLDKAATRTPQRDSREEIENNPPCRRYAPEPTPPGESAMSVTETLGAARRRLISRTSRAPRLICRTPMIRPPRRKRSRPCALPRSVGAARDERQSNEKRDHHNPRREDPHRLRRWRETATTSRPSYRQVEAAG